MRLTKLQIITGILIAVAVLIILTKKTWDPETKDYKAWSDNGRYEAIVGNGSPNIKNEKASRLFSEAMIAIRNGEFQEAKEYLDHADYLYPNSPDILTALGGVVEKLTDTKSALVYYQRSIEQDSNFVIAYLDYGTALNNMHLYTDAIDILSLGLKHKIDHWLTKSGLYLGLAIAYSRLHNKQTAMKYIDSCIHYTEDESMKNELRSGKWQYEAFE